MRKNDLIKTSVAGLYKFKNMSGDFEFYAKVKINYKIKQCNLTKEYNVVNQADAKSALELFKSECKGEKVESGDKIILNDYFLKYIKTKTENTAGEYGSYYKCHIKDRFGHLPLTDIKRTDIQEEIDNMYLMKKKHDKTPLYTHRTIQKYQQVLRNIFNEAIREELVENNPATRLKIKTVSNDRNLDDIIKGNLIIALKDIVKQIDKVENKKYKLCMLMCVFTVRRIGEILQLKYSDIDFKNSCATARKETKKIQTQSSKYHLTNELLTMIKELQIENPKNIYIFESDWRPEQSNDPFNYTTIRKHLRRAIAKTDIEYSTEGEEILAHDFRHFFGQIMRRKIKDLLLVKLILDHTDKDITSRYSQYGLEDSKNVLEEYYHLIRG